jgi:diamine N-acetyltransferase
MDVILIRGTQNDVPFVMATERLPGNKGLVGSWTEAEHAAALADAGTAYLIGHSGDEARGFAILRDLNDRNGNVLLKRIIATSPGAGFGAGFVGAITDWVFSHGRSHRLWLTVIQHNERARYVYRKAGFVEEGMMRESILRPDGRRHNQFVMSILKPEWRRSRATG